MQAENTKNNIQIVVFGCRLNALETEKISTMLAGTIKSAFLVNTCAVTAEAERQCGQAVRKLARENPGVPIFVTGCAVMRNPELFAKIPNTVIVPNDKKMNKDAYLTAWHDISDAKPKTFNRPEPELSKQFIQVQNGCNHECTYCVTRLLRGPAVSFPYDDILADARTAIQNGFSEIVLTGVDTASYHWSHDNIHDVMFISDLCKKLLADVPEIKRFRLSSLDPASPQVAKIINLIKDDTRMMPHLHLSMQSGSDDILVAMRRRHTADTVRKLADLAGQNITFSWDIICGFPGETDEKFNETLRLVRELKPIRIHAFPFSPRPGTVAATMPNQIAKSVAKQRVKLITDAATHNRKDFMKTCLGRNISVLVEKNNRGRTPHDIPVVILGNLIQNRTICECQIVDIDGENFIASRNFSDTLYGV